VNGEEPIFHGPNPEQRRSVECVGGTVVILAGAGSGRTTTVTRRIAHQVRMGAFAPTEILAVTFTRKAAGEMRERLAALEVGGVPVVGLAVLRTAADYGTGWRIYAASTSS
jgi:DNA helicase-2/ATP-dependent DNA helicase PcrA